MEIHIPTPTAVSDAGVAMATGKVQDTEQSSSCIHWWVLSLLCLHTDPLWEC